MVDRRAEARRTFGGGGVVEGAVGSLADCDLVDPVAGHGGNDGQQLGEAGADARAEHGRAAELAGLDDAVAIGAQVVPGDERGGRHHVHARRQDAHQLVDVHPHRGVDDAVRFQRQQRVDVARGCQAQLVDAAQLAHIAADLVG